MSINKVKIPTTELSDPPSYLQRFEKKWKMFDIFNILHKILAVGTC